MFTMEKKKLYFDSCWTFQNSKALRCINQRKNVRSDIPQTDFFFKRQDHLILDLRSFDSNPALCVSKVRLGYLHSWAYQTETLSCFPSHLRMNLVRKAQTLTLARLVAFREISFGNAERNCFRQCYRPGHVSDLLKPNLSLTRKCMHQSLNFSCQYRQIALFIKKKLSGSIFKVTDTLVWHK